MDPLRFYATQGTISDPGEYTSRLEDLPADICALSRIVQGVYLHYTTGETYGYHIPADRLAEIDLRYARRQLERIFELDGRPITEPRSPDKKLVSYCGSASTLLCTLGRQVGLPVRKRVGFARYFAGYGPSNHEVVEYWDAQSESWKLADPHMDAVMSEQNRVRFDVHDVPREEFMVAGQAWQACRAGLADPDEFGIADMRGWWMVRNCMIKDLAALNKIELLDWDNYGWCLKEFGEHTSEELGLLDRLAALTQTGKDALPELQNLFQEEPGLALPPVIMSFSPTTGPAQVRLNF